MNPITSIINLITEIKLTPGQYVDIYSFQYSFQAGIFLLTALVFLGYSRSAKFDQNRFFTNYWILLSMYHIGAFLALQGAINSDFNIPHQLTSTISQFSRYLSFCFFAMGMSELFLEKRFQKSTILIVTGLCAFAALGFQIALGLSIIEDRFFWKVAPPSFIASILYLAVGFYFCPCLNNRFKSKRSFLPNYSLNIPILAYGVTHALFTITFTHEWTQETIHINYNIGTILISIQIVLQYLIGIGLFKLGLLQEQARSKKLNEHLLKSENYGLVGQLSAGLVHDFNNVMTIFTCNTEMAKHGYQQGSNIQNYLDKILETAKKATDLNSKLLNISQQNKTTGKDHIQFSPRTVIQDLAPILDSALPNDINFKCHYKNLRDLTIKGSVSELEMVLVNLVINARDSFSGLQSRFSQNKITLTAESHSNNKLIIIQVRDNGSGMKPDVLKNAREFGFSTKGENGSGLGLANAQRFAEEHWGTLDIQSVSSQTHQRGTVITIQLPTALEKKTEKSSKRSSISVFSDNSKLLKNCLSPDWEIQKLNAEDHEIVNRTNDLDLLIIDLESDLIKSHADQIIQAKSIHRFKVLQIRNDSSDTPYPTWDFSNETIDKRHSKGELHAVIRKLIQENRSYAISDLIYE